MALMVNCGHLALVFEALLDVMRASFVFFGATTESYGYRKPQRGADIQY
jgi:hypothetical protein